MADAREVLCQPWSGVCLWNADWHNEGSARFLSEQGLALPCVFSLLCGCDTLRATQSSHQARVPVTRCVLQRVHCAGGRNVGSFSIL